MKNQWLVLALIVASGSLAGVWWIRSGGNEYVPTAKADLPVDSPPRAPSSRGNKVRENPSGTMPSRAPQATREAPSEQPAAHPGAGSQKRIRLQILGVVVDDLGAPVESFHIVRTRPGQESRRWFAGGADDGLIEQEFRSPDGAFHIDCPLDGQWQVSASAGTKRMSAPVIIEAGAAQKGVTLVLPRVSALAGFVVESGGAAIPGAGLFLLAAGEDDAFLDQDSKPLTRTDASGRFYLEEVIPGTCQLMARQQGYSDSEWVEITVAPGERRADVQIILNQGGRIVGRLDPSLDEPSGREVSLFSFQGTTGWRNTRTDAGGRFAIQDVIPQDYVIELRPAGYGSGSGNEPGIRKFIAVKDGETTDVVFGEVRTQITAFGHITAGGQPIVDVEVRALSKDGENSGEKASTGGDGLYELTLNGPGDYRFVVFSGGNSVSFERSVPDQGVVQFDFEVPSGRISGRIRDARGKPLARVPVSLLREAADSETESFWGRFTRCRTAADGSFEFNLLHEGTYTLRAPDGYWSNRPPPTVRHGRVLVAGLRLSEGHSVDTLDLRLPAEGRVSGLVVDSNDLPVGGAWVVLKDLDGRSISAYWEVETDATGHFEMASVAPGTYTAHVRTESRQASSEAFEVEAGKTGTTRIWLP